MTFQTILLFLFVSIFNFGFTNCFDNPFKESKLPKEMPSNVRMSFSENGGMAPTSHRIDISDGQIVVEDKKMNDDEPKKWYAKISDEDQQSLYQLFVKNKFDLIENEERKGIVYDAGSESLRIRAEKVSKHLAYGMNSPLSARNVKKYRQIANALKKLENKYQSKSKQAKTNFAVLDYRQKDHNYAFSEGKRTSLSNSEIETIEELINEVVQKYNKDQDERLKVLDVESYKHQLVAIINNSGEKEVWVNSFCVEEKNWKKSIILVTDGGNCYFNVWMNLTKKNYEKLNVNGEA